MSDIVVPPGPPTPEPLPKPSADYKVVLRDENDLTVLVPGVSKVQVDGPTQILSLSNQAGDVEALFRDWSYVIRG